MRMEGIYGHAWKSRHNTQEAWDIAKTEWRSAIEQAGYDPETMRKLIEFLKFDKEDLPPTLPKFLKLFELMKGSKFTVSSGEEKKRTSEEKVIASDWIKKIRENLRPSYAKV